MAAVGLARRWSADPAARYLTLALAPVCVVGAFAGRLYWALLWCGAVAAFAPASVLRASPDGPT